jgi:hypothetical protein
MNDAVDQLLTIAEMGAAFAGFTAIAGVLANEIRKRHQAKVNFWIMIEFSFALVTFSVIPIVLFNFDLMESTVWSVSSAAMALFIPVHLATVGRMLILPAVESGEMKAAWPRLFLPLFFIVFLVQGLNTIGVFFEQTYAAYFLGLTFFILLVFTNFGSLLAQIWAEERENV